MTTVKRPLTLLDVTCLGVNAIVGSSIFLFPGKLAALLGPASILAFGFTGLLLIAVGLCFAEAASRFDGAGGPYLYARAAFGPTAGFAIGWLCWVVAIVSWAAVANAVPTYLGHFFPPLGAGSGAKAVTAFVIAALGAVNYRGVKIGAWTTNFFTAAKLLPLIVFALVALPQARAEAFAPFAPQGFKPLGAACFLAYFAFQGFETVPVPAGELENPKRNAPIAVIAALLFASLLYMVIQTAAVGVFPGLAASERPLSEAARLAMGSWGAAFLAAGAVFSMVGYTAGSALGCPRYLVALAEGRDMPRIFAEPHPAYRTPWASILVTTGCALALAMVLDFDKLVDISNVVIGAQFAATCLAVPLLRRSGHAPIRLPGGAAIPLFGATASVWLSAQGGWGQVGWSLALLAAGFLLRLVERKVLESRP